MPPAGARGNWRPPRHAAPDAARRHPLFRRACPTRLMALTVIAVGLAWAAQASPRATCHWLAALDVLDGWFSAYKNGRSTTGRVTNAREIQRPCCCLQAARSSSASRLSATAMRPTAIRCSADAPAGGGGVVGKPRLLLRHWVSSMRSSLGGQRMRCGGCSSGGCTATTTSTAQLRAAGRTGVAGGPVREARLHRPPCALVLQPHVAAAPAFGSWSRARSSTSTPATCGATSTGHRRN